MILQIGQAIPSSLTELVLHTSPAAKAVLILLVALSLASWAIMFLKWREYRRVTAAGREFTEEFSRVTTLEEAGSIVRGTGDNSYSRMVDRAMQFLAQTTPGLAPTAERAGRLSVSQVEALRLVLEAQAGAERDRLGRFIPALAVIGSASPLIGLFGTVIGIIGAFLGLAREGSGNLGAVAPGIAEALVATALALAVAIPAVFGYNIFASRLNRIEGMFEGFSSELIALMVHEGRI
ncbi:MAG TPA: MotA/TolQ/ExbB proton channel family protein [Gemmatimonadaceae bacterium]|nr:MotA/TolQ/ExbB proton channel family protein [Gemmatimonadaceae bacterium]